MAWPWIDEFARAVESNSIGLDSISAREEAAGRVLAVLTEAEKTNEATRELDAGAFAASVYPEYCILLLTTYYEELFRLLDACRVFMRDRRGIDKLLSAEALDSLLTLAENPAWGSRTREEALKCMINSVYSRPEFVSETLVPKGFVTRLLVIATQRGSASMHWLVWKVLLVSCEAPEVPNYLISSLEAWQLIYGTLFYGFKHGDQIDIVDGARTTLLLDLIKLVTVLVNDTQWTAEQEKLMPDVFRTIHKLGGLLLEILRFNHPDVSPLNDNLVELKNKTMEVFMFLPGSLLAAFIQQQFMEISGSKDGSLLSPVLGHLHTMLLATRIEKTRPLKDMIPTLIVCYNLAKTGDLSILSCFKQAILPSQSVDSATGLDRTKPQFFKQLKFLLTCLDTDVRRYASEWLFLLCDENAQQYTLHTGVGSAIGLLRMKGLA